ncbi:sensor histidine kinase [Crossiella sp. SN42]|uniref:sensor histidine kinase n=1 Tax=Crossiella sp. SN42 TaxID=2944808 RepID=UPI00207CEB21|nr:sensor histidine kinase [Crossiella sp. SN42]MCO1577644.1 sensor histidine kinase [Crossiella sp. SN42]
MTTNTTPRMHSWELFAGFFLLFLMFPVYYLFEADRPVALKIAGLAGIGIVGATYLLLPPKLFEAPMWQRLALILGQAVLIVLIVLAFGVPFLSLFVYAAASAAILLPVWLAVLVPIGPSIVSVHAVLNGGPVWLAWIILAMLLSTFSVLGLAELIRGNIKLYREQQQAALLAVAEERARLARDLHDVLGHSLTTITLKAGLARRLLEAGRQEAAITEVTDVEALSRAALTDVRATVSGYREASLVAELAGARVALQAAGITADLPHAVDNVAPRHQQVLAYVLREGVTNVLRHSGATRCEVRFGLSWLEIRDDGALVQTGRPGTGLTGLRERLAAVGGTLDAGPLPAGGFRLRAEIEENA